MSAALLTFAAVIRSRFAYTCLIYFWTGVWSFLCVDPGLPESGAPIFTQLPALCDCCAGELLLSVHRVHVSAGAAITRRSLPSMYIFGRLHLRDVHIAVKWWLFSHYFVYFLD